MPLLSPEAHLAYLRSELANATAKLARAVKEYCPGPHELKQHRDRLPRWCETCGRDAKGQMQKKERPAKRVV